jgi:hypothetical protein
MEVSNVTMSTRTCPSCGAENNEQNLIHCYKCGEPLPIGNTRKFEDKEDGPVSPKRRWGTARFDEETIVLFYVRGHDKPLRLSLETELVMGRSHSTEPVDVDFTTFGAVEAGVSRRHAKLRRQNETIVIIDEDSANGTYLNGQKILSNEPRILRDGDEVRLGRLVMRASFEDVVS